MTWDQIVALALLGLGVPTATLIGMLVGWRFAAVLTFAAVLIALFWPDSTHRPFGRRCRRHARRNT